jgi:hypothetical protein
MKRYVLYVRKDNELKYEIESDKRSFIDNYIKQYLTDDDDYFIDKVR